MPGSLHMCRPSSQFNTACGHHSTTVHHHLRFSFHGQHTILLVTVNACGGFACRQAMEMNEALAGVVVQVLCFRTSCQLRSLSQSDFHVIRCYGHDSSHTCTAWWSAWGHKCSRFCHNRWRRFCRGTVIQLISQPRCGFLTN